MLGLVGAGEFDELIAYLAFEVSRLAKAGAEVAAFASNTPHLVFEEVRQRSPIPLISIVEATRHDLEERGPRRLGLVGTPFTMQGSFYPRVFAERGLDVIPPGLVKGIIRPEPRERLLGIARSLKEQHESTRSSSGARSCRSSFVTPATREFPSSTPL